MPVVVFWKDEVEVFRESCVVLAREAGERRCARNAAEQDVAIDATDLLALDLAGARRWFTSFGSCSIDEPLADPRELGSL